MNKLAYLAALLVCMTSEAFFIKNNSGYDVMIEFRLPNVQKVQDCFPLNNKDGIEIQPYETKAYGHSPNEYQIRFVFITQDKEIVNSLPAVPAKDMNRNDIIIFNNSSSYEKQQASQEILDAAERNWDRCSFVVPFYYYSWSV